MLERDFDDLVQRIFTRQAVDGEHQSPAQIKILKEIYNNTVLIGREWLSQADLAVMVQTGSTESKKKSSLRRNIQRIWERLEEYYEKYPKSKNPELILCSNYKELKTGVTDSKGKHVKSAYKLVFKYSNPIRSEKPSIKNIKGIYLGQYAGRDKEIGLFNKALGRLRIGDNTHPVFSIYGFGGIGKSTLLKYFHSIAKNTEGISVMPPLGIEKVNISILDWLSSLFDLNSVNNKIKGKEGWKSLFRLLKPKTVLFIDTGSAVHMTEFNDTLYSLVEAIKEEERSILIVTSTQEAPHPKLKPFPMYGLEENEIALLAKVKGWPADIVKFSKQLKRDTDGNPFMIEAICRDKNLWVRFKSGELNLSRHAKPISYLLNEMWKNLGKNGATIQNALSIAALLAHYSANLKFNWGRPESITIAGGIWDGAAYELLGKCIIKEPEPDIYEMHDLIIKFAFSRLINTADVLERAGDYFSKINANEIAVYFYADAENCTTDKLKSAYYKASNELRIWNNQDIVRGREFKRYRFFINLILSKILPRISDENEFKAKVVKDLGNLHDLINDHTNAIKFLTLAKKSFASLKNIKGLAHTLCYLGDYFRCRYEYRKAIKHYKSAIHLAKGNKYSYEMVDALWGLGDVLCWSADYDNAIDTLKRAENICKKIMPYQRYGDILWSHAHVHIFKGDYSEAEKLFNQTIDLCDKNLLDEYNRSAALQGLADLYRIRGLSANEILKKYEEAQKLMEAQDDYYNSSAILHKKALVFLKSNDLRSAEKLLNESYEYNHNNDDKLGLVWTLHAYAELNRMKGNTHKAIEQYTKSMDIAISLGCKLEVAHSHLGIAEAINSLGKDSSAEYQNAYNIYSEICSKWGLKECMHRMKQKKKHPFSLLNFP